MFQRKELATDNTTHDHEIYRSGKYVRFYKLRSKNLPNGTFLRGSDALKALAHVLPTSSTPPTCTPAYAMARQLKDCHLRPPLTALLFTAVLNTDWK